MKIILTIIISLPIVLRDIKSGYLLFRLKDNFGHQKGLSDPQTIGKHEGKYNEYSAKKKEYKSTTSNTPCGRWYWVTWYQ